MAKKTQKIESFGGKSSLGRPVMRWHETVSDYIREDDYSNNNNNNNKNNNACSLFPDFSSELLF